MMMKIVEKCDVQESMGHFEQLPDEILLDLFENYLRLVDVYYAFRLLNHRRINRIIQSARFNIDIPSKDIFHQRSFLHFSSQIISLHLGIFSNDLDLIPLTNLRYLHIEKPTPSQLLSIRPDVLVNLSYLSLSPCWYSVQELPRQLMNLVELCAFQYLSTCRFPDGKILHLQMKQRSRELT